MRRSRQHPVSVSASHEAAVASLNTLDVARYVSTYYRDDAPEYKSTPQHKGILNLGMNRIAAIVDRLYVLVQHRDALGCVLENLNSEQLEGHVSIRNGRSSVMAEVVFNRDDLVIHGDGTNLIRIGMRFTNSFNTASGIRGWMFIAENGILYSFMGLVPSMSFSIRHYDEPLEKLEAKMEFIAAHIDEAVPAVAHVIATARESPLVFSSTAQLEDTLGQVLANRPRANDFVMRYWREKPLTTNRWELFKEVSRYISSEPLTYGVFNELSIASERLINPSYHIVLAAPRAELVVVAPSLDATPVTPTEA